MNERSHLYFCAVAQRLGLTYVEVAFSGAGDSGNIDGVAYEGISPEALKHIPVTPELTAVVFNNEHGEEITTVTWAPRQPKEVPPINMSTWVMQWCERFATEDERVPWDWYNNDGGGGTIIFYPFEGRFETDGYYNETVVTGVECTPFGGPDDNIQLVGITFATPEETVEERADG